MKLLLDENLSRRIVPALQSIFPESTQVTLLGLERANDQEIWQHAKQNDYVIVTKDEDFFALQAVRGFPPKIIRLAFGNCSNDKVIAVLLTKASTIITALQDSELGMLELYD